LLRLNQARLLDGVDAAFDDRLNRPPEPPGNQHLRIGDDRF
jgi:hypothetical protein